MKDFFRKNLLYSGIIFLLIIFILFANRLGFLKPVSGITTKVATPFVYSISKTASFISDFFKAFTIPFKIQEENKKLKEKNTQLEGEIASLLELEKENDLLKKELNFFSKENYKFLGAKVLLLEPTPVLDSFIIDRGSKDGVREGMAVVSSGVLVGEVKEVQDNFSKVILINSPQSAIGAIAQNSRAEGIVRGDIGGRIMLEEVSQDENLEIGERVVTSGLGGKIKKGILIGEISEIIAPKGSLFKKAVISSPLDFKKIEFVFVIIK